MTRNVVVRYLLRQFLTRVILVTLALTGILLVFDLLGNIVAITTYHHKSFVIILIYAMLRLPEIIVLALPIGVLLAAMIVFARLASSQEMTALAATGRTIYSVVIILACGALVPAAVQVWLSNSLAPMAAQRLEVWAKNEYRGHPPAHGKILLPAWFTAGNDVIRLSGQDATGFTGVAIVRRNTAGLMTDFFAADHAEYHYGVWRLKAVRHKVMDGNGYEAAPYLDLKLALDPGILGLAGMSAAQMSLPTLWRIDHDPGVAAEPHRTYDLYIERRLAEPLEELVMILLAAPLGLQLSRRNAVLRVSFGIVAAGFLYFIFERLLLSLGYTGALPAAAAVWTPALVFGMTGTWYLLYKQEGN